MSASEKLKALDAELTAPMWRRGPGPKNADELAALRNALPQIVAVVEAAEASSEVRVGHTASLPKLQAALAALDEALA